MVRLEIYVTEDCWTCEESRRLATQVETQLPWVDVELVDLNKPDRPSNVFAAPTYLLDGRVIFLGNPHWNELQEKLGAARKDSQPKQEA